MVTLTRALTNAEKAGLLAYGSKFEIDIKSASGEWRIERNDRSERHIIAKNEEDDRLELEYDLDSDEVTCRHNGCHNVKNITVKSGPASYFEKVTTGISRRFFKYEPLLDILYITYVGYIGISYAALTVLVISFFLVAAISDSLASGPVTLIVFGVLGAIFVVTSAIVRGSVDVIRREGKSVQVRFKNPLILAFISALAAILLLRPDIAADFLIGISSYHPADIPAQPQEGHSVFQTAMSYYIITILLIVKTIREGNNKLGVGMRVIQLFIITVLASLALIISSFFAAPTRSTLINWVVNIGLVLVVELLSEYYSYYSKGE